MQKQWTLEMHHPGNDGDSLITTDRFDDFAEVERKIKHYIKDGIFGQIAD